MGDETKKMTQNPQRMAQISIQKKENISAKTGASVTGGDRSITTIEIEDTKINKGYKLRFKPQ